MFDAATEPVAAVQPDPDRAVPNRAVPGSIGQVLGVVRTLIAYGKNLACASTQPTRTSFPASPSSPASSVPAISR